MHASASLVAEYQSETGGRCIESAVVLISHSARWLGDLRHKTTTLIRLSYRCRHRLREFLSICPSRPAIPFAFATIALSGSVDAERLRRGRERLALLGTHIDDEIDATAQWRYFAGDDGQRLTSLHRALASEADVVLFARGGCGFRVC